MLTFSGKLRFLSLLLLISFLLSCQLSRTPQSSFENYLYRLNNSLGIKPPELATMKLVALPPYPSRKQRQYVLSGSSINLIEFLRLSQCKLQRHIGQRNSSLGQVMPATQILIYEVNFIVLAQQCLAQLSEKSDLRLSLSKVVRQKQQRLDKVMWNASFASDEFVQLFSLSSRPLSQDAIQQPSLLLNDALKKLLNVNQQLSQYTQPKDHYENISSSLLLRDLAAIEDAYRILAASKRMGELRLSMQLAVHSLAKADAIIHQRLDGRPLCLHAKANAQYAIVETVFEKYYIGDIQPYIASLHQQSSALFKVMAQLLALQQPTDAFLLFWAQVYSGSMSEWKQFDNAIAQHTQSWQKLLEQCGRLPS